MNSILSPDPVPMQPLALRPREAAAALGVSERCLWQWTQDGDVPHIKRGKCLLYPVDALREWLAAQVVAPRRPEAQAERGAA